MQVLILCIIEVNEECINFIIGLNVLEICSKLSSFTNEFTLNNCEELFSEAFFEENLKLHKKSFLFNFNFYMKIFFSAQF